MQRNCYQIKISLKGIRPPIWRRFQLPADCTMDAVHSAIQITMNWTDTHLYSFRTKDRCIEIPDPDNMWDAEWSNNPKPEDSGKVLLSEVAKEGNNLIYIYDFGDSWVHTLAIEKNIMADPFSARKALCLKGKRACPPEDCGGVWGYQGLLEMLEKKVKDLEEDEKEMLTWLGSDWDSEAFYLDEVNTALADWKPDSVSGMYGAICD